MTLRTIYLVQTFEIYRKRLVPTGKEQINNLKQAIRSAEAVAQRKAGAAAIEIIADDETSEIDQIKVLAKFGQVPEDFEEIVMG